MRGEAHAAKLRTSVHAITEQLGELDGDAEEIAKLARSWHT